MAPFTRVISSKVNATVRASTPSPMEVAMKDPGRMVDTMDLGFVYGRTGVNTKENGSREWLMVKALKRIPMGAYDMKVFGRMMNPFDPNHSVSLWKRGRKGFFSRPGTPSTTYAYDISWPENNKVGGSMDRGVSVAVVIYYI
jgi:hypothetical protein